MPLIHEYQFVLIFKDVAVVGPDAAVALAEDSVAFVISGYSLMSAQIDDAVLFVDTCGGGCADAFEGIQLFVIPGYPLLCQYPQYVITVAIKAADGAIHKTAHPVVPVFIQAEPGSYPDGTVVVVLNAGYANLRKSAFYSYSLPIIVLCLYD